MTNFQFPLDGTTSYKGKIKFKAVREDYKTVLDRAVEVVSPVSGSSSFELDPRGRDQIQGFTGASQRTLRQTTTKTSLDTASLYLPNQINFRDAAEYQNVSLGMIGGAAALALNTGGSGARAMVNAMGAAIPNLEDLQDAFVNGLRSETAQVAALRTVGRLSEGVGGAIETETGITLNPNRRSTFKGVGLRRFNFSFQLIPTSSAEATRIKEIIGFFRHNMYPDLKGQFGSLGGTSAAFTFPSKFEISMVYGSKRVGTMTLPMFLEHVNVTYNPNSMAFHTDGEPQETVVDLAFIEERALTKPDIVKDHILQGLTGRYKS